jgi:trk system potassium uptake protein TrkA
MGCGRVGSSLAIELEAAGHTVSVIDQAREAFRRLGPNFKGRTVTGVGFDRDTLLEAGIQEADAFAAVSNGDNSNILAARVARETYGVQAAPKFTNAWAFRPWQQFCGLPIKFCVA